MRKNTKVLALVLVGLLTMGTVGYVVYAQTAGSPETAGKSYLARVAEKLGVTEEVLLSAMYAARAEMIDEAVAAGRLTQAQADYLKAVLQAQLEYCKREGCPAGLGLGFGPKGFARGFGCGLGRGLGRGPGAGMGPWWQAPGAKTNP